MLFMMDYDGYDDGCLCCYHVINDGVRLLMMV